jgi:hypothetical protein
MTHRLLLLLLLLVGSARGEGKLELTVSETAGIRRFGYPVHATLKLPREASDKDRFRLLAGDKPVPAQFRLLAGEKKSVAVDFNVSLAPAESKTYTVEYGPKVEAGPEPKGGMKLEESKEAFTIRSDGMVYVVPRDLKGFLKEVRNGKKEYLRAGSGGLYLVSDRKTIPIAGAGYRVRVVRQGPLTVALRFEGEAPLPNKVKVSSVVDLTFPRSKSWVEVNWGVKLPHGVEELGTDLNLLVAGSPTLVDFGAGSGVYTTLTRGQAALLQGFPREIGVVNRRWEVSTGQRNDLRPFVVPNNAHPPEGWAHVMDRQRCTAAAMSPFARYSTDEIRIDADGRFRLRWRSQTRRGLPAIDTYRFWLHFVDMPVQVGALTSPQSMMAPLEVKQSTTPAVPSRR